MLLQSTDEDSDRNVYLKDSIFVVYSIYIYIITELKITTTNNTYILCRSWRRKTQGHLASTKKNFQKSIIHVKKTKLKKYTQQTTQHSEKKRD